MALVSQILGRSPRTSMECFPAGQSRRLKSGGKAVLPLPHDSEAKPKASITSVGEAAALPTAFGFAD